MTTRWLPDTCDCILLFQPGTTTFVQWEQRCDLHKALSGQTLLDTVLTHNRSFAIAMGVQNVKANRNANIATKIAAKAAIKAAGPTTINPAFVKAKMWGRN